MENIKKIGWNSEQLWNGCILAGIAHAIMVAHYPDMANEQSWEGFNYSVQDSMGQRGTVSFSGYQCVAAFRNDKSERASKVIEASRFFQGANEEILNLAKSEALQYLLDEIDGNTIPFITTAFWGEFDLYSNDTTEELFCNGGGLLEYQVVEYEKAVSGWAERYDMNTNQVKLLKIVYDRKINSNNQLISLSKEEIDLIGISDEQGLEESRISFEEMGIQWS